MTAQDAALFLLTVCCCQSIILYWVWGGLRNAHRDKIRLRQKLEAESASVSRWVESFLAEKDKNARLRIKYSNLRKQIRLYKLKSKPYEDAMAAQSFFDQASK